MQFDDFIKTSHSSTLMDTVDLRLARPTDLPSIQRLSQECFPISYPDDWFIDLINEPQFLTIIATRQHALIGMIIAEYRTSSHCRVADRTILNTGLWAESVVAYILSLGVTAAYRRHGLASLLLYIILQHAQLQGIGVNSIAQPVSNYSITELQNESNSFQPTLTSYRKLTLQHFTFLKNLPMHSRMWPCRALYLHVLRSNTEALQFYERQGFHMHRVIPACYLIDGKEADGLAFVLHINGGQPQPSIADTTISWLHWFRNIHATSSVCGMLEIGLRFVSSVWTKVFGDEDCSAPQRLKSPLLGQQRNEA